MGPGVRGEVIGREARKPTAASSKPICNGRPARSRSNTYPNSAVKNTWVCISTEASAAVIPICSAVNRKPNCPTPWNNPNSTTQFQCSRGGLTSSTSGNAANT